MADDSTKASKKDEDEETPKYPRQRLIDEAPDLLNLTGPEVAGGLATISGTGPVTAEQAKDAVKKFLKIEQKEA